MPIATLSPITVKDVATIGLNLPAVYNLSSSILLGSTIWHGFIGGPLSFTVLPRMQFGNLQGKLFPVYFGMQTGISAFLLAAWFYMNPQLQKTPGLLTDLTRPDSFNAALLLTMTITGALNSFVVGPMTTKTMKIRHKLEREEGKKYNDANVSDDMKALNKRFGMLHGISSLINIGFVLAAMINNAFTAKYGVLI